MLVLVGAYKHSRTWFKVPTHSKSLICTDIRSKATVLRGAIDPLAWDKRGYLWLKCVKIRLDADIFSAAEIAFENVLFREN